MASRISGIPYSWIDGLPSESQRQIERDFLYLLQLIDAGSGSIFDAIIDPALTTSDPAGHKYKNLVDLAANELWAATATFNVGVIARGGLTINEGVGGVDVSGRGHMTFTAAGGGDGNQATSPQWDWKAITVAAGQTFLFKGIALVPSVAGTNPFAGTGAFNYVDSYVSANMACASMTTFTAYNSTFQSTALTNNSNSTAVLFDCVWDGSGNGVTGDRSIKMYGGRLNPGGGGTGFTFDSTGLCIILAEIGGNVICHATNSFAIIYSEGRLANNLTVSGVGGTIIEGTWNNVVFQAATSNVAYVFNGRAASGLDVTGPAKVDAAVQYPGGGVSSVIARGSGITGTLHITSGISGLKLVGCTDSQFLVDLYAPGPGNIAYNIDSASARCVIVLSGSHNANWGAGSVNAGTNVLIIDELGIIAAPGGPPFGYVGYGMPLQGPQGDPGEDGLDGFPGLPGPAGAAGTPGSQGAAGTGAQGKPGDDGEDGMDGFPGPRGADGPTGPQGAAGVGARGQAGEDGEDGLDGLPGAQGAIGPTGLQGASIQGKPGDDGEDGWDGYPGYVPPSSGNTVFVADADYTMGPADRVVIYTSITANRIVTLPSAAGPLLGTEIIIMDGANACTPPLTGAGLGIEIQVKPAGAETVETVAAATNFHVIRQPRGSVRLRNNTTTNWNIVEMQPRVQKEVYTVSSAAGWRRPLRNVMARVRMIGGGGGGGSGEHEPVGTKVSGGGAGSPGSYSELLFHTGDGAVTESVVVGNGGAGGLGVTATGAGNDGTAGLKSTFTINGAVQLTADGGLAGKKGAAGVGGAAGAAGPLGQEIPVVTGGVGSDGAVIPTAGAKSTGLHLPAQGGGGGGATAAALLAAAAGGASAQGYGSAGSGQAGVAGGGTGIAGGAGTVMGVASVGNTDVGGGPGGGGAPTLAGGIGGKGGNGTAKGQGGAGGGGGLGATGVNTTGAGGDGQDGYVEIITYN